jgi:uncharacterized protein (TIGR02300 family)
LGAPISARKFRGADVVVKAEWGAKHTCLNCDARFYDLQQPTAVCPSCDTAVPKVPVRASRARSAPRAVKKPVIVAKKAEPEKPADNEIDEDGGAVATVESVDDDENGDNQDETVPKTDGGQGQG